MNEVTSNEQTRQILELWGLSEYAISVLSKEPEIVADLAIVRELEPFGVEYTPQVFEVLFDDVVYIRWEKGREPLTFECSENYQPPFTEYALDEQTALFLINGEVVVNRAEKMKLNIIEFLQELTNGRRST